MKRIMLTVAYDGTNYSGWQIQPRGVTIEQVLNEALSHLLREEIHVLGVSRTDAGVHSLGNLCVFDTETQIPAEKICYAVNQGLPTDIVVIKSQEVPLSYHPRKCSSVKTYEYVIYNNRLPNPVERLYSYFFYMPLDLERMQKAASYLVGEHDFKSFCSARTQVENTVRTILSLTVNKEENKIRIRVSGTGFLYNMVRIIVGTLIRIGTGLWEPDYIKEILEAKDRQKAGPKAPAEGLTLQSIELELDPYEETRLREELVQADLDSIYIGNLSTVDTDLTLPEEGNHGTRFTWFSGEERFIDAAGKVNRPLYGMGNRKVTLTVTGEYKGVTKTREFTATVLQQTKETKIVSLRPVVVWAKPGEPAALPSVIIARSEDGRTLTVPVTWDSYEIPTSTAILTVCGHAEKAEFPGKAEIHYGEAPAAEPVPQKSLNYVSMKQVRLLPGTVAYELQQHMMNYLRNISDDSMLYNFRKAAGLSTENAEPMKGWDAEECKLKGHTTGHYLSGLALAYAATGEPVFRQKIHYMVTELEACQSAFDGKEGYHSGFLSAYSEEQFDLLEQYTKYPEIWAPYYTLDKIMCGLYDCYTLADEPKALEILTRMGDWTYKRLSRLPKEQLNRMWSMYIAGEFGGMYGTMIRLYGLTGKQDYLKTARLFYNEKLFYPMAENCDTLEDMHGNQHIPQIIGIMQDFDATGMEEGFWIASNFWEMVTKDHAYSIGGVGETEMFHGAGTIHKYITEKAAESCASYNMERLTAELFAYVPESRYMDYYERALLNHTFTSCSRRDDGGTTYFMPLNPGGKKFYDVEENTCCHGTGMESRFRYMEHIYAVDEAYLYVNLFLDNRLTGENCLQIRQIPAAKEGCISGIGEDGAETGKGIGDNCESGAETEKGISGIYEIRAENDHTLPLAIRVPGWAKDQMTIRLQGEILTLPEEKGYIHLTAPMKAGECVTIELPMAFREEICPDDDSLACLAYGPYIMAEVNDGKQYRKLPLPEKYRKEACGCSFCSGDSVVMPFAMVDEENYHVYFRR